jgi:hypothetical protein
MPLPTAWDVDAGGLHALARGVGIQPLLDLNVFPLFG